MTCSEPGHIDIIEGHAGIECGQPLEVPVTAPQYDAQHVVVSAAATAPWEVFTGRGATSDPMKIVVIGASGTIGTAVTNALESMHRVVRASRRGPVQVDIGDPATIAALFESITNIDAIVCCAASVSPTPLASLSDGNTPAR